MGAIEMLLLAVVQGVTEFLPVSSSGHLVVLESLLEKSGRHMPADLIEVNVALHLGTLVAVLVYYRQRIFRLMGQDRRVLPLLVFGSVPAALVGVPLERFGEHLLNSPLLAGLMFPVTAVMLIWASRRPSGTTDYPQMAVRAVLIIGLFQAFAILPGVSRSGATIAAGLAVGLRRDSAATFAFLLAIPAIGGAGLLKALDLLKVSPSTSPDVLALGMVASFLVGLAALALLVRLVQHGRLAYFAFWLLPLGLAVTVWQLAERIGG